MTDREAELLEHEMDAIATEAALYALMGSLADEFAGSLVTSHCVMAVNDADGRWYDSRFVPEESCDQATRVRVGESVGYLEARGLLARHPAEPMWVRVKSQHEGRKGLTKGTEEVA